MIRAPCADQLLAAHRRRKIHKQSETPTVKTAGVFTIADFDNNSNPKPVRGQFYSRAGPPSRRSAVSPGGRPHPLSAPDQVKAGRCSPAPDGGIRRGGTGQRTQRSVRDHASRPAPRAARPMPLGEPDEDVERLPIDPGLSSHNSAADGARARSPGEHGKGRSPGQASLAGRCGKGRARPLRGR